ncbi:uncharacterized protein LOC114448681 isoform X2 [Parambassis ranga]|nr:uncharacterized protein LOC114448681 isoform X2 [Parambassis ranga]
MPSLSKQLKGITEPVIGLQYVWEYRSPSKSVQPHYQCKLCAMSGLQHDVIEHTKGWKHSFRYMKKAHHEKVIWEEENAVKDPAIRRSIKEAAAEIEKMAGRGQIKVVLKEPCEVPAFKGLRSAVPKFGPSPAKFGPSPAGEMGPQGPSFGPRFSEPGFPGEYLPHGGHPSEYPMDEFREGFGGYLGRLDFPDSVLDRRPFPDSHRPGVDGNSFCPGVEGDAFRSGLHEQNPNNMYHDGFRGNQMGNSSMNRPMDNPVDRPGLMGAAPESGSLTNTLLTYLDTFRIENEHDAQLVLKVTQKLTDVLMEYRLRSVSEDSEPNNLPMSSTNFSSFSRLPSNSDRYSSNPSGPSRYSDGPRYYN